MDRTLKIYPYDRWVDLFFDSIVSPWMIMGILLNYPTIADMGSERAPGNNSEVCKGDWSHLLFLNSIVKFLCSIFTEYKTYNATFIEEFKENRSVVKNLPQKSHS